MIKYFLFAVALSTLSFLSCTEDVTSPEERISDFSRLYVSFEEYGTSTVGIPDTNIRLIARADSDEFVFDPNGGHVSQARGGGIIYFNPFLQSILHASANTDETIEDSALYVVNISIDAELTNSATMSSPLFHKIRGMTYHRASDALFVVNADGDRSGIFVVDRPTSVTATRKPYKQFFTGDLPMWGAAYSANRLFVSKQGDDGGIYVFDGIATAGVNGADSTANIAPARTLAIDDARNLHGIFYDTLRNVMAVTDYTDGITPGTGRILIFDSFGSMVTGTQITPSRIITGAATQLTQPVDVALDTRSTGRFLYVADRSGKVLRFLLTDEGNVAPESVLTVDGKIPVALALDTRDDSTLPQF